MPPDVQLSKESVEAELVDMTTASRMLGISRQAVYQHIVRGHLQSVHPGVASLVWVRQVKVLQTRLESYRQTGKPGGVDKKTRKKLHKASNEVKRAINEVVKIRAGRNTEIKSLKEMYKRHIGVVRGLTQKSKLRKQRNEEIRGLKRSYLTEIERIRASIRKNKL